MNNPQEPKRKVLTPFTKVLLSLLVLLFVGSSSFLIGYTVPHQVSLQGLPEQFEELFSSQSKNAVDTSILQTVWKQITSSYVNQSSVNAKNLYYGMLKGLVSGLNDPYSVFMTPDETDTFTRDLSGTFEGIGAELAIKDNDVTVVSALKDSPAQKADIRSGDIVKAVDTKAIEGMTLDAVVTLIRGQKGTAVTLSIVRKGVEKPFDVKVTRETIQIKNVAVTYDSSIAIITLTSFNEDTKKELDAVVQEIALKQLKGIILDLRNNPGGLLNSAVDVSSVFLPEKSLVVIEEQGDGQVERLSTSKAGKLQTTPLIVLINNGSASASEIVAGALHDHKRARLVGETSFGKGTVQNFEVLPDGSSLKLTIAQWLTPNGTSFNKKGIEPDVVVSLTEADYTQGKDPQMDQAKKELP